MSLTGGGGAARPDVVTAMLARIEHRARDGSARFASGPFAAGYGRTRAKGVVEEPFTDDAGRICVVDGWIASRSEIAAAAGRPETASDPELLVALVSRHGLAGLSWLRGEIAFVIWDPAIERMIAGRDTMGVKPLFYTERGDDLRIASEPAALVLPGEPKRTLHTRAIAMALVEEVATPAETWLENVHALLPGHLLVWERGRMRVEPFRPLSMVRDPGLNANEADLALEAALRAATRDALEADAPVCIFVSGGLDSTTVAALAIAEARESGLPEPLLVTWRYPGMECDEGEYTVQLAKHLGVEIASIDVPRSSEAYEPTGPLDFMHEGSFAPLVASVGLLREKDIRVMISGIGADELFITTGFEVEATLAHGDIRRALAFADLSRSSPARGARRLAAALARAVIPAGVREQVWGRRWTERMDSPAWLTPWGRALVHEGRAAKRAFLRPWNDVASQEYLAGELAAGWQGPRMLEQLDISSHAVGAMARFPYLDARVVELFTSLDPAHRYDPEWQKILLRRIAARHLPASIAWRRDKTLFEDFYRHAVYAIEPTVRRLFETSELERLGIAQPGSLLELLRQGRSPDGFQSLGRQICGVLAAEVWLRKWAPHCAHGQGPRL
ncbi:MAG: asparagine synthetase B [Polyangiaceae bacterium]|nr:asparagine synthetase B [Polyangiaceae bacterium]